MLKVTVDILEKFIKGEYVMRYNAGYWNGICSNTYIETTFMNYKKVPGSIIGITLKTSVVEKWANRLHVCTQFLKNFGEMREFNTLQGVEYPEERIKTSITKGEEDRNSLRPALKSESIHYLQKLMDWSWFTQDLLLKIMWLHTMLQTLEISSWKSSKINC